MGSRESNSSTQVGRRLHGLRRDDVVNLNLGAGITSMAPGGYYNRRYRHHMHAHLSGLAPRSYAQTYCIAHHSNKWRGDANLLCWTGRLAMCSCFSFDRIAISRKMRLQSIKSSNI